MGLGELAGAGEDEVAVGGRFKLFLVGEHEEFVDLGRVGLDDDLGRLGGLHGVDVGRHDLFADEIA